MHTVYDTRTVHPLDRYEYYRAGAATELAPLLAFGLALHDTSRPWAATNPTGQTPMRLVSLTFPRALAGLRPIPTGVVGGRFGWRAPVGGIKTVTGGPVRCMNRVERLVGLLAARPTGAHDDRSA
jgi:hypothetical protein